MARKLEGRVFYMDTNNGVTAIAPAEVVENFRKRNEIWSWFDQNIADYERRRMLVDAAMEALGHLPVTPVFTFVREERAEREPWITGEVNVLGTALYNYIIREGGKVQQGLFVPFSNGAERGMHGIEAMQAELAYVTTRVQFIATFGVSPEECLALDGQTKDE